MNNDNLRRRHGGGEVAEGGLEEIPEAAVVPPGGHVVEGDALLEEAPGSNGMSSSGGRQGGIVSRSTSGGISAGNNDGSGGDGGSSAFNCNICFDTVREPVVTFCGHLYCWPCLARWYQQPTENAQRCPICKAVSRKDLIIPIYGRGEDPRAGSGPSTTTTTTTTATGSTPERPSARRPPENQIMRGRARPVEVAAGGGGGGVGGVRNDGTWHHAQIGPLQFSASFGFLPSLFLGAGVQRQDGGNGGGNGVGANDGANGANGGVRQVGLNVDARAAAVSRSALTIACMVLVYLLLQY